MATGTRDRGKEALSKVCNTYEVKSTQHGVSDEIMELTRTGLMGNL